MKNKQVCEEFFNHREACGSNLRSTGDKLFSYNTCIAQWDDNYLLLNETKYSTTTSKHQTYLQYAIRHNMLDMYIIRLNDVYPRGEQDLKRWEQTM